LSFQIKNKNNIFFGEFGEFLNLNTIACTSFRQGGVSSPPFQSLNTGLHTKDTKKNILKNRELFFSTLNIDPATLVCLKQIHSSYIVIAKDSDKGRGALDYKDSLAEADGIITNQKSIPLVIFTADCMPLFFLDPQNRIAGIAHAGWKGTLSGIAGAMLNRMLDMGASKEQIFVGLGPSIQNCCYQVKKNLIVKFDNKYIEKRNENYYLNLCEVNKDILIASGMKEENIIESHYCTSCHIEKCYSYRKEGQTGRMASVIMMKE